MQTCLTVVGPRAAASRFRAGVSSACPLLMLLLAATFVVSLGDRRLIAEQPKFVDLFDGHSLDGWEQHGGKATYRIEDGVIIGTAVANTPNSFLCTKRHYADFALELEFLVDAELNSGIQIRSEVFDEEREFETKSATGLIEKRKIPAGRVHGYQVEIDPSERAWTAGIYDESRRGWLNDLQNNEPARKAFRQGEWNKVLVVAVGRTIKTWLNGVPAANLKDDMTRQGFIALQVHGVAKPEHAGKQVKWRHVRIIDLGE